MALVSGLISKPSTASGVDGLTRPRGGAQAGAIHARPSAPGAHMHLRLCFLAIAIALASLAATAHAADIASAKRKDGTTIVLTDDMLPECNRLSYHGAARMQRGKSGKRACWTFDWKKRVFTVMPLTPRETSKNVVTGIAKALGVEREAAWIEQQLHGDTANKLSLPGDAFTWYGKKVAR
jgi:hypothetical protein